MCWTLDGCSSGAPALQRAVHAFVDQPADHSVLQRLWLATVMASSVWDDTSADVLSDRYLAFARRTGALMEMPTALNGRIGVLMFTGEHAAATALAQESAAVVQAIGGQLTPYGELGLAAWRGRETEARSLIASTKHDILARGEGVGLTVNLWSSALLDNGLGRYQDAMEAATQAAEHRDEPIAARSWALIELVEAAAHCGHTDAGQDALRRLSRGHASVWDRLGTRRRGALAGVAQRTRRRRRRAIAKRSIASPAHVCASISPARSSSTANGCDGDADARTRASNSGPPTKRSLR